MELKKKTGRTLRMVNAAIRRAYKAQNTVIIVLTRAHVVDVKKLLVDTLVSYADNMTVDLAVAICSTHVEVYSVDEANRFVSLGHSYTTVSENIFVDHAVIEDRYQSVLEAWVRWDAVPVSARVSISPSCGTGRTTKQMQEAPPSSFYVWCNEHTDYPKKLARELGRDDLQVVSPRWLTDERWRGCRLLGLVLDHATLLTGWQADCYERARRRVQPLSTPHG